MLLSTRPGAEWVRARRSLGRMNLPVDRPCGFRLVDVGLGEAARLVGLHGELVRCVLSPRPRQLVEIDLFVGGGGRGGNATINATTDGLMERLSRAVLGTDVPKGVPRAFPKSHVNPATSARARSSQQAAHPYVANGRGISN